MREGMASRLGFSNPIMDPKCVCRCITTAIRGTTGAQGKFKCHESKLCYRRWTSQGGE
ncbi:hypothetical protein CGRA01v4_07434 [Colletotrichum graminicola]|nr:hypothetical protein CGRA01v4_07434 [Colletotrichum graminicola]